MPEKHRRYLLKEKESTNLLRKASQRCKVSLKQVFGETTRVEVVETPFGKICLINMKPTLVVTEADLYPTLVSKELFDASPKIVVDMGAVAYVCKGANIMAPGIRRFEGSFAKGDIVFIIDEKHGKPIALGEAAYDVEEAKNTKHGMVVKNIHYVGDNVWKLIKDLTAMPK